MEQDQSETPLIYHTTRLRVPLYEVDLGQAVYHGNYFHLLELGREAFMRDLGYPYKRFMDGEMHLTIVEVSCHYRKSLRYDDDVAVQTAVRWWRSRSLGFEQAIHRMTAGNEMELCTQATLNMVCVRFSGRPTVIPREFMDLLKDWMATKA